MGNDTPTTIRKKYIDNTQCTIMVLWLSGDLRQDTKLDAMWPDFYRTKKVSMFPIVR